MNAEQLLYHIERSIEAKKFGILSVWPGENGVHLYSSDFFALVKANDLKITIKKRESLDCPFEARTKLGAYTIYALLDEEDIFEHGLQDLVKKGARKNESV